MLNPLLTPEYLDDAQPALAHRIENCRHIALNWLMQHNYKMVIPPLVEHIETLIGYTKDLDIKTFKLADTLSERTLGIRADHTPQIARFDSTYPQQEAIRRYCYCGPTLYTRPAQPWESREGLQLGAEIFGMDAPYSDWEIISTVLDVLHSIGIDNVLVDIGHATIFEPLLADASHLKEQIAYHIGNRNNAALDAYAANGVIAQDKINIIKQLINDSHFSPDKVQSFSHAVDDAIFSQLFFISRQLESSGANVRINFSHLGSHGYHSGLVFKLYDADDVVAYGGRYRTDNDNEAVGFSLDLRLLAEKTPLLPDVRSVAVPLVGDDNDWLQMVQSLQRSGRKINFMIENPTVPPFIKKKNNQWILQEK